MTDLADDARVIAGATAGPWEWDYGVSLRTAWGLIGPKGKYVLRFAGPNNIDICPDPEADMEFITRARTRYPALVAEVRELRDDLQILITALQHAKTYGTSPHFCSVCGTAHDVIAKFVARAQEAP